MTDWDRQQMMKAQMEQNARTEPELICGYCHQVQSQCQGTQMCDDYWNAIIWEEGRLDYDD